MRIIRTEIEKEGIIFLLETERKTAYVEGLDAASRTGWGRYTLKKVISITFKNNIISRDDLKKANFWIERLERGINLEFPPYKD